MRIVLEQSGYALLNLGDWAMLEVAVRRLRALFPGAELSVLARDPARLAACVSGVRCLTVHGRTLATGVGCLLGRIGHKFPARERALMHRWPALSYRIIHRKSVLRRRPVEDMDRYFHAVKDADLVVATGGGYLTDSFPGMVDGVCTTMELAQQLGKPTAMLGQGLGPLTRPELWSRVASVLRRLDLVTLREGEHGPSLLQKAGVSPTRYVVTGDDAIELAYSLRRADRGSAIGVNLRTAGYAGLATESAGRLGHILQATARDLGAPLVSVPISLNRGGEDVRAISELMAGYGGAGDAGASISTPAQCIRQIGGCRLVVTGSYHAGVFALSQGIPAIGLVGSEYYRDKFGGLRAQFGRGCESIALDAPDFAGDLRRTVTRFYEVADDLRQELLEATVRQIDTGVTAYERLHDIVRTDVTRSVRQRAT